ncbi:MAG: flagellar assembly protein FliW [Bdellovibrionales bacterium]|nr:flagellar assembly protein FliW [Bdellovibrionales bacterium]
MIVRTGRFGELSVEDDSKIFFPEGVLGFADNHWFSLIDPGDETLILWLQSLENPNLALPVLEPKIFRPDYSVRLSAAELRILKLDNVNQSAVFSILTIPEEITEMSANLKAPVVINLREKLGRQVVLQENEYSIKQLMFKELRTHLLTIAANSRRPSGEDEAAYSPIRVHTIPPSLTVRGLSG